jgi:hypothetical protein
LNITHWIAPSASEPEFAARIEGPDGQIYSAAVSTDGNVSVCRRLMYSETDSLWCPETSPPRSLVELCRKRLVTDKSNGKKKTRCSSHRGKRCPA